MRHAVCKALESGVWWRKSARQPATRGWQVPTAAIDSQPGSYPCLVVKVIVPILRRQASKWLGARRPAAAPRLVCHAKLCGERRAWHAGLL